MKYSLYGTMTTDVEITVEAESSSEAKVIAREALLEGTRPDGLIFFWTSDPPELDLDWKEMTP